MDEGIPASLEEITQQLMAALDRNVLPPTLENTESSQSGLLKEDCVNARHRGSAVNEDKYMNQARVHSSRSAKSAKKTSDFESEAHLRVLQAQLKALQKENEKTQEQESLQRGKVVKLEAEIKEKTKLMERTTSSKNASLEEVLRLRREIVDLKKRNHDLFSKTQLLAKELEEEKKEKSRLERDKEMLQLRLDRALLRLDQSKHCQGESEREKFLSTMVTKQHKLIHLLREQHSQDGMCNSGLGNGD